MNTDEARPVTSAPPVAVEFLERLLFDSEPIEAVATLSSIWQARADPKQPRFGLSRAEYLVQLCLIYTGEVGNGGHAQFFMNRGDAYVAGTLDALRTVSLAELADILSEAAAKVANQAFEDVPDAVLEELELLDRSAFRRLMSVDAALLAYVRSNRSQILVPETPLAKRSGHRAE